MKKKLRNIVVGVAVIILIGIFLLYSASAQTQAILHIEEGTIQVNSGSGWETAVDNMQLSQKDMIKTLENSYGVILLDNSIVIQLEPETEISLEDLDPDNIQISESLGTVWIKFVSVTGIKSLSVETPNTLAIVRGTELGVSLEEVRVIKGDVEVQKGEESIFVNSGYKVVTTRDRLEKEPLSAQDVKIAFDVSEMNYKYLNIARLNEVRKNQMLYDFYTNKFNLNDVDVDYNLDQLDQMPGPEYKETITKLPVKPRNVQRAIRLTEVIREDRKTLQPLPLEEVRPELKEEPKPELVQDDATGNLVFEELANYER